MCDVVTGCDISNGKEEGYFIHVDLGSTMWKSTNRVRVLLIFGQANTQDIDEIV